MVIQRRYRSTIEKRALKGYNFANPGSQEGMSGASRRVIWKTGGFVMTCKRMAQLLCAVALLCGCIFSQTTTGILRGTVTDPGDAALPGAQIELKNNATGAVVSTVTGPE